MIYLIPTPIGNLHDISYRTVDILSKCDIVISEDTRVSKSLITLLNKKFDLDISPKRFFSLHSHNSDEFFSTFEIDNFNKTCVYMSDAGMPGISDPGLELVRFAIKNCLDYEILPGASAVLLVAVCSGMIEKEFVFLGFLSNSGKDRQIDIENALNLQYPCIIYESPKRVIPLLENIYSIDPDREIFAIKEATKKFEKRFFGSAKSVLNSLQNANLSGEWALVIQKNSSFSKEKISTHDIISLNIAPKIKAKLLSKLTGDSVKDIYSKLCNNIEK